MTKVAHILGTMIRQARFFSSARNSTRSHANLEHPNSPEVAERLHECPELKPLNAESQNSLVGNDGFLEQIGSNDESDTTSYWFAGARHDSGDQFERFIADRIWQHDFDSNKITPAVLSMRAGDRIAIKSNFVRRYNLPFDVGNKPVSAMRIKATGTIIGNDGDGRTVRVSWDPLRDPRDWYFYTYRSTLVRADAEDERGRQLIEFAFHGADQHYERFLSYPYWAQKYANILTTSRQGNQAAESFEEIEGAETQQSFPAYSIDDIVSDGCFLERPQLEQIMKQWKRKKNIILQGPPGTGKTWLAKRLGFVMVGSQDRDVTRSRLRVVQFHPSLSYEDFVRGWRPSGDGRLSLVDGMLLNAIDAARAEPDIPFVLVIEEINRGNPAQIFGEMLTLLENTKRTSNEAMELAYAKLGERVYVPENLFIIGTMNVADRSLALVDLALRRRFAFVDLEPRLGTRWQEWCAARGLSAEFSADLESRFNELNRTIEATSSLGPQFRVGHSYITPDKLENIDDPEDWFLSKVENEIRPLIFEYYYDSPEVAKAVIEKLLIGFADK